jgi:hypothetical protein
VEQVREGVKATDDLQLVRVLLQLTCLTTDNAEGKVSKEWIEAGGPKDQNLIRGTGSLLDQQRFPPANLASQKALQFTDIHFHHIYKMIKMGLIQSNNMYFESMFIWRSVPASHVHSEDSEEEVLWGVSAMQEVNEPGLLWGGISGGRDIVMERELRATRLPLSESGPLEELISWNRWWWFKPHQRRFFVRLFFRNVNIELWLIEGGGGISRCHVGEKIWKREQEKNL